MWAKSSTTWRRISCCSSHVSPSQMVIKWRSMTPESTMALFSCRSVTRSMGLGSHPDQIVKIGKVILFFYLQTYYYCRPVTSLLIKWIVYYLLELFNNYDIDFKNDWLIESLDEWLNLINLTQSLNDWLNLIFTLNIFYWF